MPDKNKKNTKNTNKSKKTNNNTTTTILSITSPISPDEKIPIPTICINVNEQNNNSVNLATTKAGVLNCLPEIFTDIEKNHRRNSINNNLNEKCIKGDLYKPYIFGKFHHHHNKKKHTIFTLSLYKFKSFTILFTFNFSLTFQKYILSLPHEIRQTHIKIIAIKIK